MSSPYSPTRPHACSCAAGEYLSNGSCLKCPVNTYQPTGGANTECLKCPEPSFAHFEGSTACVACYFGQPVVIAGDNGLWPNNMPREQPTTGEGDCRACG